MITMASFRRFRSIPIALVCVPVLFSLRALAHHSLTVFDRDTEISIEGAVVEWYLGMPHAHLTIEATDANGGMAVYQLDFSNTLRMIEDNGWDESSFQPGDRVSVTGSPSRLGNDTRFLVATLRQPDGEVETFPTGGLLDGDWTRDTLSVGDRVTFSGAKGRNAAKKMYLSSVRLADGSTLRPGSGGQGQVADASLAYENVDVVDYGVRVNEYPADITGAWNNRHNFRVTVDDLEPNPTPFTDEAVRMHQ